MKNIINSFRLFPEIFILAMVLFSWYVWNLDGSLLYDEGIYAYEAFQILKGDFSSNDMIRPFAKYFFALSVLILGYNDFALRIVSVLFAIANVFLIYFIAKRMTNRFVAFFSALLISITPFYAMHAVRAMLEMPLIFFVLLIFLFTQIFFETKDFSRKRKLMIAIGFCTVAAFATKLYTILPISVALIAIFFNEKFFSKKTLNWIKASLKRGFSVKGIFLVGVSGLVLGLFMKEFFLFSWNLFGERQAHAFEKIPLLKSFFSNYHSLEIMLLFLFTFVVLNFLVWIIFSLLVFATSHNPAREVFDLDALTNVSHFLLLPYLVLPSSFFSVLVSLWLLLWISVKGFILLKKVKLRKSGVVLPYIGFLIIFSAFLIYLPLIPNILRTIMLFLYDTYFMTTIGIDTYVFGHRFADAPVWAYLYWMLTHFGYVFIAGFIISILTSLLIITKKISGFKNHWLLFLTIMFTLGFLSMVSTKVPRYLLVIMPLVSIYICTSIYVISNKISGFFSKNPRLIHVLSSTMLVSFLVLPGIIIPYGNDDLEFLLRETGSLDRHFSKNIVPFYLQEWGISNTMTSPLIVTPLYPNIRVDSGLEEAAQVVKDYVNKNQKRKIRILVWQPANLFEYYFGNVPENLVIYTLGSPISHDYLLELLKDGKIEIVIMIKHDPEGQGFVKLTQYVERNFVKKQDTKGYVTIYYMH